MLLLSDLTGCIHHKHAMLEEEYGYCPEVSQVVSEVFVVSPHENLGLILLAYKVTDAFVCRNDASRVFARLFNDFFGFIQGTPDLGPPQLLKFSHNTLGHD